MHLVCHAMRCNGGAQGHGVPAQQVRRDRLGSHVPCDVGMRCAMRQGWRCFPSTVPLVWLRARPRRSRRWRARPAGRGCAGSTHAAPPPPPGWRTQHEVVAVCTRPPREDSSAQRCGACRRAAAHTGACVRRHSGGGPLRRVANAAVAPVRPAAAHAVRCTHKPPATPLCPPPPRARSQGHPPRRPKDRQRAAAGE